MKATSTDECGEVRTGVRGVVGRIGTYWDERETPEYDGDGAVSGTSIEDVEKHAMAKGEFGNFAPGRAVIVRNDGWIDGQTEQCEDVVEYITGS